MPAGFRDTQPPLLDLKEQPRLVSLGDGADGLPLFAGSQRGCTLRVRAHDAAGRVAQMRLRVGPGSWSDPRPYAQDVPLQLPPDAGTCLVSVRAADEVGNWSPPVSLRVVVAEAVPHLVGPPTVRANRYGVVVSFQTDVACYAKGEVGSDPIKPGPAACQHVQGVLFSRQATNPRTPTASVWSGWTAARTRGRRANSVAMPRRTATTSLPTARMRNAAAPKRPPGARCNTPSTEPCRATP